MALLDGGAVSRGARKIGPEKKTRRFLSLADSFVFVFFARPRLPPYIPSTAVITRFGSYHRDTS